MIVLDTNVVSELMRPAPADAVVAWLRAQPAGSLVTTAVTVAEIRHGLARRATDLESLADEILGAFEHQVLPFDARAAGRYGPLVAGRARAGRPIAALDAQIAAICLAHGSALATRNTTDFADTGVVLIDPWQG